MPRRNSNNNIGHAIGEFFQHPFKNIAHSIGEGIKELGDALGGVVRSVSTPIASNISQTLVTGVQPVVKTSLEGIGNATSNITTSLAAPLGELKWPLVVGGVIVAYLLLRR